MKRTDNYVWYQAACKYCLNAHIINETELYPWTNDSEIGYETPEYIIKIFRDGCVSGVVCRRLHYSYHDRTVILLWWKQTTTQQGFLMARTCKWSNRTYLNRQTVIPKCREYDRICLDNISDHVSIWAIPSRWLLHTQPRLKEVKSNCLDDNLG